MLEHRDAFMETLRSGPELRRRIFESLEQRFGDDFGKDRIGRNLYETLHSAVQDADVPDALAEFEKRFLPLVDGRRLPRQIETDGEAADEMQTSPVGRARGWIMAIVAAAVVVGGLVGGLSVLNSVLAKHQAKAKPPAVEGPVSEPAPAPVPQRTKPANPIRTLDDDQAPAPEGAPTGNAPSR